MKIKAPRPQVTKARAKLRWHRWFAWHPVRITSKKIAWLETIERKGTLVWDDFFPVSHIAYQYRAIAKSVQSNG